VLLEVVPSPEVPSTLASVGSWLMLGFRCQRCH
jgi:hypothetical protein